MYLFVVATVIDRFLLAFGEIVIGKLSKILKELISLVPESSKLVFPELLTVIVLWGAFPIGTLPKFIEVVDIFKIAPNTFKVPLFIVVDTDDCVGDETTKPAWFKLKLPGKVFDFNFNVNKIPELPLIAELVAEYMTTLTIPSEGLLTAKSWVFEALDDNTWPFTSSKTVALKVISNWMAAISSVLLSEISKSKLVAVLTSLLSKTIVFWAIAFCIENIKNRQTIVL